MTDSDLRELDGWIAEHFLDHARVTICEAEEHTVDWYSGYCATCNSEVPKGVEWVAPAVSSDPSAFALVKREIERREGAWSISYYSRVKQDGNDPFFCSVWLPNSQPSEVWAASEELAGCLAVKAAVEGSDGN